MEIRCHNISKRYRTEWVFRDFDFQFSDGGQYAITGPNGSGKSTLLRILAGHLSPSKGRIVFQKNGRTLHSEEVPRHLGFTAPYMELIEELTLAETLRFHQKFKPFVKGLQTDDVADLLAFPRAISKPVRFFSSGMKQRLKLVLALCSESSFILLDEPSSNLDRQGMEWYLDLVRDFAEKRTLIVASNQEEDYSFCQQVLDMRNFK